MKVVHAGWHQVTSSVVWMSRLYILSAHGGSEEEIRRRIEIARGLSLIHI